MTNPQNVSVLFVCMGNICRSPTAEGVFRRLLEEAGVSVDVDSAGTHAYHIGNPPDRRSQAAAAARGVDLSPLRARQVHASDYERFDLILAMDSDNLEILQGAAPAGCRASVRLFLEYAPDARVTDVPDPYYGGEAGFERVLDLVEEASRGLLASLRG